MPPQREVSLPLAGVFAVLTLAAIAAAIVEMRDGGAGGNPLLVILGALFAVLAAFGGYETYALATGLVPTISVVTDDSYIRHRLAWLAVYAVVTYFSGLLAEHFTWQDGHFAWRPLVLGAGLFLLGGVTAVIARFAP